MSSTVENLGLKNWSDIVKHLFNDTGAVKNRRAIDISTKSLQQVGFATNDETAEKTKQAAAIGSALQQAEDQYVAAIASGNQTKIQAAEMIYQKAERVFAAFSRIMKNAHELMMELIRNLR